MYLRLAITATEFIEMFKLSPFQLNFSVLFVVGTSEKGQVATSLRNETENSDDLVIGDFRDSYSNNTIKVPEINEKTK